MRFHNTLGNKLEDFSPIEDHLVKMYHCGPTVYGIQHIGNLSMFVFTDILRRSLEYKGYAVKQVINFTDFGHLSSDSDEGEDKMTKGLKQEGLELSLENMKILGKKYAEIFLHDIATLNVRTEGTTFPYASDYVPEQIALIEKLEEKGYAYATSDGVYFDTSKFKGYGKLGGLNTTSTESRVGISTEKRNYQDFALWKFGDLGWDSKWGKGFPGWHIECSAMIIALLGEQIDIHTGGVEHIAIHHNNEIAQSEAATGKEPFSRFWLHRAHLQLKDSKIAKSEGNVIYLSEIIDQKYSPLALRYFLLGAHYKTPLNFTWEALGAAESAYKRLKVLVRMFKDKAEGQGQVNENYKKEFSRALENDLNTSEALAVIWKLAKNAGDDISYADALATLLDFDQVLGLKLDENEFEVKDVPEAVQKLLDERQTARDEKDFNKSDALREEIGKLGFEVKDTEEGQSLSKF